MASPYRFSAENARESIRKTGAFAVKNTSIGQSVVGFQKRLPFKTPEGLEFCAQNSLLNEDVRTVIESSIDRPHWGLAKIYRGDILPSDRAYFFFDGPDMQVVLILLWSPGSRFLFFEGSHSLKLPDKEESDFGILTLRHDQMRREGVTEVEVEMSQGGFTIIDGRVGWTVIEGYQIAIGYASEAEISHWGKVELGNTEALQKKVKDLNARGIKTNFTFVDGLDASRHRF